jgi:AcrR family transcriptional regulator
LHRRVGSSAAPPRALAFFDRRRSIAGWSVRLAAGRASGYFHGVTSAIPAAARRRKPGDLRRREIADAALRIIAEQGLGRFTAMAVARETGLSDGALFRHFASMEDIVLAAIDRVEEILFEDFPPAAPDPLERLGAFFLRRVAAIAAHPGVARLVVSEDLARAAPPAGVRRVAAFRQRSAGFVGECLAEAAARRLLGPGVRPAEARVVVFGALMALAHAPHLAAASGAAPDRLAGDVWGTLDQWLRRGVAPAPPRTGSRGPRRARTPRQQAISARGRA